MQILKKFTRMLAIMQAIVNMPRHLSNLAQDTQARPHTCTHFFSSVRSFRSRAETGLTRLWAEGPANFK